MIDDSDTHSDVISEDVIKNTAPGHFWKVVLGHFSHWSGLRY